MDGFYDQQVPFMGPGVSLPRAPLSPVPGGSRGRPPPGPLTPWSLQKSCTEEGRGRLGSDRKRKFLETDLAHDSEGERGCQWVPVPSLGPEEPALLGPVGLERELGK